MVPLTEKNRTGKYGLKIQKSLFLAMFKVKELLHNCEKITMQVDEHLSG